jgi:hypothetical protein
MEEAPKKKAPVQPFAELGNVIWADGWKTGRFDGFSEGFKAGKSAMSGWAMPFVVIITFTLGGAFGVLFNKAVQEAQIEVGVMHD